MSVEKIGSFKALLSPREVQHFCTLANNKNNPPGDFRHRLLDDCDANGVPWNDPNVRLKIPILTGKKVSQRINTNKVYDISVYSDGTVQFKKGQKETVFQATHQYPIDYEYLAASKEHPLIVDPFAALLAVYSPDLERDQTVEREHFRGNGMVPERAGEEKGG